jgi:anaerobic ribonucleoside-triphosphate reductase activating protein
MILNVSRLHYPVTALGPGRRAGIWVQGCTLACPGCVSRDTWNHLDGNRLDVDGVLQWLADACRSDAVDGITISGGEPTEQPEALYQLVSGIDDLRRDGVFDGDVLCYTGLDDTEFHERCGWAAGLIDAIITGRFDVAAPTSLVWRGSANQRLQTLTPRGQRVYAPYLHATSDRPDMQFTVTDGQVWMIGIPRRGDLQRLESALCDDGVTLEEVSWRP